MDGRDDEEVLWRGKREKWFTRVTPGEVSKSCNEYRVKRGNYADLGMVTV